MSLRPPPRRQTQPPAHGADPRAALETAIAAAETVLAGTVPRLAELTRVADQTRQELEGLLLALRGTLTALHGGASPFVAPPPRIVPPPLPAAALDAEEVEPIPEAIEEAVPRRTSPLEETAEMPQLSLREDSLDLEDDEDEIRFVCEKCGKKLSAPKRFAGKKAGCKCGVKSTVPLKSTREKGKA